MKIFVFCLRGRRVRGGVTNVEQRLKIVRKHVNLGSKGRNVKRYSNMDVSYPSGERSNIVINNVVIKSEKGFSASEMNREENETDN